MIDKEPINPKDKAILEPIAIIIALTIMQTIIKVKLKEPSYENPLLVFL